MPMGGRKVPYSGKAKKQQLKAKKLHKTRKKRDSCATPEASASDDDGPRKKNTQQHPVHNDKTSFKDRYALKFHQVTDEDLRLAKQEARKALEHRCHEKELEVDPNDYFPEGLTLPTRPPWDFSMSKHELNDRERKYFEEYLTGIEQKFDRRELSYFELNLETWRQLWRVLEMSDIALVIVDIRFPALMFPPYLYDYITKELNKDLILVLNKIDLAPPSLVVAWKHYLTEKYPDIHVVLFTSFPSYNLREVTQKKSGLQARRCKGRMKMAAEGAQKLFNACKNIVKNGVDLSSWEKKISEEMNMEFDDDEKVEIEETINLKRTETDYRDYSKYEGDILTIGCIGHPNVGKSSLMNALMGKKVVSVSRTPGHTKHFQTIFLTPKVRLCDCPGLVFPSKVPKSLQVLMGSYPIAQLRDPYSTVKYLAERLDLVNLLRLEHPDQMEAWSAMDICESWAIKKGFFTARSGRPDIYRGANHLLRTALDGKICLRLAPPDYFAQKGQWESHEEIEIVEWIQASNGAVASGGNGSSKDQIETSTEEEKEGEESVEEGDEDKEDEDDSDCERLSKAAGGNTSRFSRRRQQSRASSEDSAGCDDETDSDRKTILK